VTIIRWPVGPGFVEGGTGTALIVVQSISGSAFSGDTNAVYFCGHQIKTACAARERFGVPCPGCGLTRSVVLTMHGHPLQGFVLNPAGPLGVLGVAAFAFFMLGLSRHQHKYRQSNAEHSYRLMLGGLLAYAVTILLVLMAHWLHAATCSAHTHFHHLTVRTAYRSWPLGIASRAQCVSVVRASTAANPEGHS
jgi:hypothetical protein